MGHPRAVGGPGVPAIELFDLFVARGPGIAVECRELSDQLLNRDTEFGRANLEHIRSVLVDLDRDVSAHVTRIAHPGDGSGAAGRAVSTDPVRSPPSGRAPSASACEPYREIIADALAQGRNAVAIWLLRQWASARDLGEPEALMFATRSGKPIAPKNLPARWIVPAGTALGLPRISWLTFRRTYASWAHEKGVPGKVVATLMGHAKVDVTLNTYTRVIEAAARTAANVIGSELFSIVQSTDRGMELTH
jgi:hypothetical protein